MLVELVDRIQKKILMAVGLAGLWYFDQIHRQILKKTDFQTFFKNLFVKVGRVED
jgi:thioredoxin-related protein